MADKLMNITNNKTSNYPLLYITNSGWNVWTLYLMKKNDQNLLKSPKLISQRIRKCYYKTLGTSVINSPMSPSSMNSTLASKEWIYYPRYSIRFVWLEKEFLFVVKEFCFYLVNFNLICKILNFLIIEFLSYYIK